MAIPDLPPSPPPQASGPGPAAEAPGDEVGGREPGSAAHGARPPPAPPSSASKTGRYPKAARLRKDRDFQPVRTRGRRFTGVQVVVRSVGNETGRARLGVASPKRYGDAVRRNRFRRLVRAAFRSVAAHLPARDLLVEPRRDLGEPDLETIRADLERALGPRT